MTEYARDLSELCLNDYCLRNLEHVVFTATYHSTPMNCDRSGGLWKTYGNMNPSRFSFSSNSEERK